VSHRHPFAVVVSIVLLGCEDPPTPRPPVPEAVLPASSAKSPAAASAAPIGVAKDATWILAVDAARVLRDDTLKTALSKTPFVSQLLGAIESKCGVASLQAVERVLASGSAGRQLFALRVAPPFDARECFAKFATGKHDDDPRMTPLAEDVVGAGSTGSLFIGHPNLVREALDGHLDDAPAFPETAVAVFDSKPAANPPLTRFSFALRTMAGPPNLDGEIVFATSERRSAVAAKAPFDHLLAKLASPSGAAAEVGTDDLVIRWSPAANEPAKDGSVVAAIGILAASVYLRLEKTHEARTTVVHAAEALFASLKSDAATQKKIACPETPPRVPATIPSGERLFVRPSDWVHPTWQKLGPPALDRAFYQYAVTTSEGGHVCIVSASGDLNADGVTAEFRVPIDISKGKPVMGKLEIDREIE
jgi:hypothetical protein